MQSKVKEGAYGKWKMNESGKFISVRTMGWRDSEARAGRERYQAGPGGAVMQKATGFFVTSAEFTPLSEDLCSDFQMLKEKETVQWFLRRPQSPFLLKFSASSFLFKINGPYTGAPTSF